MKVICSTPGASHPVAGPANPRIQRIAFMSLSLGSPSPAQWQITVSVSVRVPQELFFLNLPVKSVPPSPAQNLTLSYRSLPTSPFPKALIQPGFENVLPT
jgi:hypothetical protein